jgi:PadR family transcriptional regulator PadR
MGSVDPIDRRGKSTQRTKMNKNDLLQGTLDMLILRILSRGEMHGWGIADRIEKISESALSVGEGSLYPALYRMEEKGWIDSSWGQSDNNRKAKFYVITKAGRKQLDVEEETWNRLSLAVAVILRSA